MVATTVIAAIGVILVGLFTAKAFLIWIGAILFFIGFGGASLLTNSMNSNVIIFIVALVIIIKLVGGKK